MIKKELAARLRPSRPAPDPRGLALAGLPSQLAHDLRSTPLTPAAVLVPIIERAAGLSLLLTRRADHLKLHPGQISFPGGRVEHCDSGELAAALREAEEELGIPARLVEVAGYLPPQVVIVSGFVVTPVVGFLPASVTISPDDREVAEVIEAPLSSLLKPDGMVRTRRTLQGIEFESPEFHFGYHRIWGVTANIIDSLRIIVLEKPTE